MRLPDERAGEVHVAPVRERVVGVLGGAGVHGERRIENGSVNLHGGEQLGEDRRFDVEIAVRRYLVVMVLGGRFGHAFPREATDVGDHIHPAVDDLEWTRREDHAVCPHAHALAVSLRRDVPHDLGLEVCVDLDACRVGALRSCYCGDQIGLACDRLHPRYLARGFPGCRGLGTRICQEGGPSHERREVDVGGVDHAKA